MRNFVPRSSLKKAKTQQSGRSGADNNNNCSAPIQGTFCTSLKGDITVGFRCQNRRVLSGSVTCPTSRIGRGCQRNHLVFLAVTGIAQFSWPETKRSEEDACAFVFCSPLVSAPPLSMLRRGSLWVSIWLSFLLSFFIFGSAVEIDHRDTLSGELKANSTSVLISSSIFAGSNVVYDFGIVEARREVHVAGSSGILIVDMDSLITKSILNVSSLLTLAGADKVAPGRPYTFTSATFLPNYGKPVWVIAIRVAGVFVPKIGVYAFDALSWQLLTAHSPLGGIWLPTKASDSAIVFDGTSDNTFSNAKFNYQILYNTLSGFQAYLTPTTDIMQSVGKLVLLSAPSLCFVLLLLIACVSYSHPPPKAPSPSNPRLLYGMYMLNATTGVAHFRSLDVKACTSIHPRPVDCRMMDIQLDLAHACRGSAVSIQYWYSLYRGPFAPSVLGFMVQYQENVTRHLCFVDINSTDYTITRALDYTLADEPGTTGPGKWAVISSGDSNTRQLVSVYRFYNPKPNKLVTARLDVWFRDSQARAYFNITGISYPLGPHWQTVVSADARLWFFVKLGGNTVQIVRTQVAGPDDGFPPTPPSISSSPSSAVISARIDRPIENQPSPKPVPAAIPLLAQGGACTGSFENQKVVPLRSLSAPTRMEPGIIYAGNVSVNTQLPFTLDVPYDLSSVTIFISATTNRSAPSASFSALGRGTYASVQQPNPNATIAVPYLPKSTAFINVTSPFMVGQYWSTFTICAEVVPAEAVFQGKGKIFQGPSENYVSPIAAVPLQGGGQSFIYLDQRGSGSTGVLNFTVRGCLLGPVGQPPTVLWQHSFLSLYSGIAYDSTKIVAITPDGSLISVDFVTGSRSRAIPLGMNVSTLATIGLSADRVAIFAGDMAQVRKVAPEFPPLVSFPANFTDDYCTTISNVAFDELGYCYLMVTCLGLRSVYIYGPDGKQRFLLRYVGRATTPLQNGIGSLADFQAFSDFACIQKDCFRGAERYTVGSVYSDNPVHAPRVGPGGISLILDLTWTSGTVSALKADVLNAQNPVWKTGLPFGVALVGNLALSRPEVWGYDQSGLILLALNATDGSISRQLTWPRSGANQYTKWVSSLAVTEGVYFSLATGFGNFVFYVH